MKLNICAYCGSVLRLNDFGRCGFCNGAYKPIEGTIPYEAPIKFVIPTMDSFIDDILNTKSFGIISGSISTGKTSILLDIAEKIKDSRNFVFIAGDNRYNIYPKNIDVTMPNDIEDVDISQFDTVLIDDFKFVPYDYNSNYRGFVHVADKYQRIVNTFHNKSVIATMSRVHPYLKYSAKYIANLKAVSNRQRNITFEQWPGKKVPYTIEMEII